MAIKLTSFSHGAGCGCKLSPAVLHDILSHSENMAFERLLVGNDTSDDAAVFQLDADTSVISTTDFFMPIVDDPHDFGAIAATNAISDVYAMGGTPIMAIAILGWPIDKLSPEVAGLVLKGGREVCHKAGIPLAGGHSIDSPEPIFGLAVTGRIRTSEVRKNNMARAGDLIYLTKGLGIGLVTTAQKQGKAEPKDLEEAKKSMLKLNTIGADISGLDYIHAVTDVTGFGLAGHLLEVLEASKVGAKISLQNIPRLSFTEKYLEMGTTPGGTQRNWDSYGNNVEFETENDDFRLLADPQTSGGLLITIDPSFQSEFESFAGKLGHQLSPIGSIIPDPVGRLLIRD